MTAHQFQPGDLATHVSPTGDRLDVVVVRTYGQHTVLVRWTSSSSPNGWDATQVAASRLVPRDE